MAQEQGVGKIVRKLREANNLTQRRLSVLCGVSPMQIARIEKGESQPTEDTIRALAVGLNVPVSYLFGETIDYIPSPSDPTVGLEAIFRTLEDHAPKIAAEVAYVLAIWHVREGDRSKASFYGQRSWELVKHLNPTTLSEMAPILGTSILNVILPTFFEPGEVYERLHHLGIDIT